MNKGQRNKLEVIHEMESFVAENLGLLESIESSWQPSDLLPNMDESHCRPELEALQTKAKSLAEELLVVLVGNMITEEALPSYETWLNGLEGIGHQKGASDNPWARWARGWTAEENRHGTVLQTYLFLTGRVNMKAVAESIQYLIRNGFDPLTDIDPYYGLVYTSFQERATNLAHRNTGRLALKQGDELLARICQIVAGDEARHEKAYKIFFKKVIELDPNGAVLAFAEMMKRKIIMPAKHMVHGREKDLFLLHIVSAQRIGVYTARDYADIVKHLVEYWNIENLKSLTAEAAQAQEFLCGLAKSYYNRAPKLAMLAKLRPKIVCPWLFDRKI